MPAVFQDARIGGMNGMPAEDLGQGRALDQHLVAVLALDKDDFLPLVFIGAQPAHVDAEGLRAHLHLHDGHVAELAVDPLLRGEVAGVILDGAVVGLGLGSQASGCSNESRSELAAAGWIGPRPADGACACTATPETRTPTASVNQRSVERTVSIDFPSLKVQPVLTATGNFSFRPARYSSIANAKLAGFPTAVQQTAQTGQTGETNIGPRRVQFG